MIKRSSSMRLRRRVAAMGTAAAVLATAGLTHIPAPAGAFVFICSPAAVKPGGTGTKAHGKWYVACLDAGIDFEIQVQLWERDAGPDQRLSSSGWISRTSGPGGISTGRGPNIPCDTEAGKEELYSRVQLRYGGPSEEPLPWMESAVVTSRTCA